MFRRPFDIPTVGLIGGPGAGKSMIWQALEPDPRVRLVPEVPTLLHGLKLWHPSLDPQFEIDLDDMRWLFEKKSARAAHVTGALMLLTDRIMGEGRVVYCSDPEVAAATPVEDILASYHALIVVDLPPPDIWFANRPGNGARTEQEYEQALEIHTRILEFVRPHPRQLFVGNDRDADSKIGAGVATIDHLLNELEQAASHP